MNTKRIFLAVLIALTFAVASTTAFAGAIQDRMKARIPEITLLKNNGIIGEDNRGYLAYVGKSRQKNALINAENVDRNKIYQAIAKKTNSNAEAVGKRRAAQIFKNGIKGHWYQDSAGKWSKKK